MDVHVPPAIAAIAPDGQLTPAQWRRFMIDFCRRRIQPGTGSAPEFLQMKIAVSRAQDVADLSRMLGLASEDELARVRALVARYAPDDAEDLESLIYLGQIEMGTQPKTNADRNGRPDY